MYEKNAFITLTYAPEYLESPKLQYRDFQLFMKRLRKAYGKEIGVFVTGEYGDETKRPHWHAIIFNWAPPDPKHKYTNDRGDRVSSSETLTKLWGKGVAEFGTVTIHSAGYCARYAAKKLIHGHDSEHEFHPISKKSNKHAIGKKWLERYWPDVFSYGNVILKDGTQSSIPRYYEKWFKENRPAEWQHYVTLTKLDKMQKAQTKAETEQRLYNLELLSRNIHDPVPLSKNETRKVILESRFKILQQNLKL